MLFNINCCICNPITHMRLLMEGGLAVQNSGQALLPPVMLPVGVIVQYRSDTRLQLQCEHHSVYARVLECL